MARYFTIRPYFSCKFGNFRGVPLLRQPFNRNRALCAIGLGNAPITPYGHW